MEKELRPFHDRHNALDHGQTAEQDSKIWQLLITFWCTGVVRPGDQPMQLPPGSLGAGTAGLTEPDLQPGGSAETWDATRTCSCGATVSEFLYGSPRDANGAGAAD